jgi:hypothetical protein
MPPLHGGMTRIAFLSLGAGLSHRKIGSNGEQNIVAVSASRIFMPKTPSNLVNTAGVSCLYQ